MLHVSTPKKGKKKKLNVQVEIIVEYFFRKRGLFHFKKSHTFLSRTAIGKVDSFTLKKGHTVLLRVAQQS